jgi:NAD(P)-dependent dehydrogenase (short-subunit alcohol dehydrogenase family)
MLAREGARSSSPTCRSNAASQVAAEIGGAFVKCDVSQEADGQAVVAQATAMGKLMGLVNCAGIAPAEKTVGKDGAHALACSPRPSPSTWSAAST